MRHLLWKFTVVKCEALSQSETSHNLQFKRTKMGKTVVHCEPLVESLQLSRAFSSFQCILVPPWGGGGGGSGVRGKISKGSCPKEWFSESSQFTAHLTVIHSQQLGSLQEQQLQSLVIGCWSC